MKIQSKILVAALAMTLPALALAAQPLAVRYDGHDMPMHQTVEVMHTAAGPVQVKTWTWQSPQGHARVVIEQSSGAAAPAWALRQMHTQFAPMQRLIERVDAQMNAQMNAVFGPMSTLRVLLPQSPWLMPPVLPTMVLLTPQQAPQAQPPQQHPAAPVAHPAQRWQA